MTRAVVKLSCSGCYAGAGARLEPAGWTAVDVDSSIEVAAFVQSLDGDFAATAELGCATSLLPGAEVVCPSHLRAGVSYGGAGSILWRLAPTLRMAMRGPRGDDTFVQCPDYHGRVGCPLGAPECPCEFDPTRA